MARQPRINAAAPFSFTGPNSIEAEGRNDLQGEIYLTLPQPRISRTQLAQDVAAMIGFHSTGIRPRLQGSFAGYRGLQFVVISPPIPRRSPRQATGLFREFRRDHFPGNTRLTDFINALVALINANVYITDEQLPAFFAGVMQFLANNPRPTRATRSQFLKTCAAYVNGCR